MRFLLIAAFFMSCLAFGGTKKGEVYYEKYNEKPPKALKDGKVRVYLKDGNSYEFSSNTHKVIPRGLKCKARCTVDECKKQCPKCPKQKECENRPPVVRKDKIWLKNRISIVGGLGPAGLRHKEEGHTVVVEQDITPLIGLRYSRYWTPEWDTSIEIMSVPNEEMLQEHNTIGAISLGFGW